MNELWVEKIDKYLGKEMSLEEESAFESELATNKELESVYKLQKSLEKAMRTGKEYKKKDEELLDTLKSLNAKYFTVEGGPASKSEAKVIPLRQWTLLRKASLVAASILVVALAYIGFFNKGEDTQKMAENYINSNDVAHISPTMGGAEDSLQQGIRAYNSKEYGKALQLFEGVYRSNSNSYAKQYIGQTYLMTKEYDKALQQFEELINIKGLHNPGLFLKAATLLQRNGEGDKERAKQALQQVLNQQTDKKQLAKEWLKKL